jgi:Tfp pilus assembly protein PilX
MTNRHKQRGVALVIGLIFLVILTVFVLGGLRDVLLQERMSGAFRNQSLANNAKDSMLRNGEALIFANVVTSNGSTQNPAYRNMDNEAGAGGVVRDFRTGTGYQLGGIAPTQDVTNAAYPENKLSKPGAYVIEGPLSIGADAGLLAAVSGDGSYSGTLITHNSGTYGAAGKISSYRLSARATGLHAVCGIKLHCN